jgi:peptide/nickel transport system substrate-binding protein
LPYVWPDPCARTLSVNNAVPPWDDKDMRWVLSNVMDRRQIVDVAYEGSTIPGAYFWPLYPSMQKYTDMVPKDKEAWMRVPHLDEAEKTLKAKGYAKSGKYWAKDGKTLALEIQVHEAYSELERIADVYVEQLQKFGIDAKKAKLTGGTWGDNYNLGKFETMSGWQTCGSIMEPYNTLRTLLSTDGTAKIGERPVGRQSAFRYNNPKYNEIVDKIALLPLDDPQLDVLAKQAIEILYDDLPVVPTAQSRKLIPNNFTYWTNWPDIKNHYTRPVSWCGSFLAVLTEIKPAK